MILQGTTPTLTITVNPDELLLADVVEIELTFQSGIGMDYAERLRIYRMVRD